MGVLDNRVAIVTAGGGPGMGSAFCKALAGAGAAIVVADIDADRAAQVAKAIVDAGGRAVAVPTDVSNSAQVAQMVERTLAEFGTVGILVNHAGVGGGGRIETVSEEAWDRSIAVHLKGAFLCSKAVLPHMRAAQWGRIVSTASRAGYRPSRNAPGLTAYAAAKAGVTGFSRALAMEVGLDGITVNVIAPRLVSGGGMLGEGITLDYEAQRLAGEGEGQVLPPRHIRPDEVAGALMYLVGPSADRVTGTVLHVNSGSYFPA